MQPENVTRSERSADKVSPAARPAAGSIRSSKVAALGLARRRAAGQEPVQLRSHLAGLAGQRPGQLMSIAAAIASLPFPRGMNPASRGNRALAVR